MRNQSTESKEKFQQALSLHQQGRLDEAKIIYSDIIKINPNHADSLHLLGVIFLQTKDYKKSVDLISSAIAINSSNSIFYSNLSTALMNLNRFDLALDSCNKAIELTPNNPDYYYNRANTLKCLKSFDLAISSYDSAIKLNPSNEAYYYNRGVLFSDLKKFELAVNDYDKVIKLNPMNYSACLNRGNDLVELRKLDQAVDSYDMATRLRPESAEAYSNLANAFDKMEKVELAIFNYDKAIRLKPDYVEAYSNYGNVLVKVKQLNLALTIYEKAINIKENYKLLLGKIIHVKSKICDWNEYKNNIEKLKTMLLRNEQVCSPFFVLSLIDSLSLHHLVAKTCVKNEHPLINDLGPIPKRTRSDKIRVGYYSADFHNHPVSYLASDLFASHDRSKFELIGFSFGHDIDDEMRRKVKSSFDKFIDVRLNGDLEIAKLSRQMGIDIAVDLHGFTRNMRLGVFSARCAPIQVNYIGYPATIGASYIDYLVTDKVMVPKESYEHYSEKIVYLPDIYLANCKHDISEKIYSREELGLPDKGFIFCCFNNNNKITPDTFDGWMRIMKDVEGSVLWLFVDNELAADNLKKEAEKRGINSNRIIFADRMPMEEHLARHKLADLFLDTFPYTAHTTCGDSIWAGLPVLTLIGESYPSRVSAAILSSTGLSELITKNQKEYEARAIEIARNPEMLKDIKEKVARNRVTSPVYDIMKMTKSVESAYEIMYDRYQNDLLPDNIEVDNLKI